MIHTENRKGLLLRSLFFVSLFLGLGPAAEAGEISREWVEQHYTKREVMVPMRDGIRLYTAIYEPVGEGRGAHPILMQRTPYGCHPYGKGFNRALWNGWSRFAEKEYIFVWQDVRGRRMSEGRFVNVRPVGFGPEMPSDDASDAYDTAEWLVKNTSSNGRIGITGNSYLGYYALVSALCAHPAIRAVCPQAPVGDWFMGDDTHHNGVLMLTDAFSFLSGFHRPYHGPSREDAPYKAYFSGSERDFFLGKGALKNVLQVLGDSIGFWNDMAVHPNYDAWWQARNYTRYLDRVRAAVMVVGGLFDAEDLYGAWNAYYGLSAVRHKGGLYLLMGPWSHGGWSRGKANSFGTVRFSDDDLGATFRDMEQEFFDYYLLDEGRFAGKTPQATVYFTGENRWRTFAQWPSKKVKRRLLYLHGQGRLSFSAPREAASWSEYVSDPSNPVPYSALSTTHRRADYMIEDQRFAEGRADVLTFSTGELEQDITLGGSLEADLWASLSTTDADFVVKLIDVFPADGSQLGGYEMLVRGDIMRGRYRKSFTLPEAFVPGRVERVRFRLPDVAHTFRKGHRIMVQIQSTWFPLADRNPQQLVNVWTCAADDFLTSQVRIYHQKKQASCISLPVISQK